MDVLLHVTRLQRWDDLRLALTPIIGVAAEEPAFVGTDRCDLQTQVEWARLPPGTTISFGHPPRDIDVSPLHQPPDSAPRLEVVGGADLGASVVLRRGEVTVGRGADCDLVLTDPEVSRHHLRIEVSAAGVAFRDLGSTNGTELAAQPDISRLLRRSGRPRSAAQGPADHVQAGALGSRCLLRIGDSVLAVTEPVGEPVRTQLPPETTESALFTPHVIELGPPSPATRRTLATLLAAGAPLGMTLAMVSTTGNLTFLFLSLLSPLLYLASSATDPHLSRRSRRVERRSQEQLRASAERRIVSYLGNERRALALRFPGPLHLPTTDAAPPESRVRIGLADVESSLVLRQGDRDLDPLRHSLAPCTTDLAGLPLVICGVRIDREAVARALVAGLVSSHRLIPVHLVADHEPVTWRWLRWLTDVRISDSPTSARQHLIDLLGPGPSPDTGAATHEIVIVLGNAGGAADAALAALSKDDRNRRLLVIQLRPPRVAPGRDVHQLTIDAHRPSLGRIVRANGHVQDVLLDRISVHAAERVARAVAAAAPNLRHLPEPIPTGLALGTALGLTSLTQDELERRWTTPSTEVVVGISDLDPVTLDLAVDGPHLLVAGTTGAGKSEFVRTLLLGLALNCPPEVVTFVLVDYKGGATFNDLAGLPHTAGLVTDLDSHLTRRALESLSAEIVRRERLFRDCGVSDFGEYDPSDTQPRLPRLVLVIDEFAGLAEELPEFLDGVLAVARRGRSLGIHLVLATQRPAGVVTPEIAANVSARLALRLLDPSDSLDIVGSPAAAHLPAKIPGRAVASWGAMTTTLQVARPDFAPDPAGIAGARVLGAWNTPRSDDAAAPTAIPGHTRGDAVGLITQLSSLASKLCDDHRFATVPAPWLPPLPARIALIRPEGDASTVGTTSSILQLGVGDDPAGQRYVPVTHDLADGGVMAAIGASGSGRTTLAESFAHAAALLHPASDLHLYVIDGSGSLGALDALDNCGAISTSTTPELTARIVHWLDDEVQRRLSDRAERSVNSVAEAQHGGPPFLVLVIDDWEAVLSASDHYDGGRTIETLLAILRRATSCRLTVLLTGGRALFSSRVAPLLHRRFLMNQVDTSDFSLAGIRAAHVPAVMMPGRAIEAGTGRLLQFLVHEQDALQARRGAHQSPPYSFPAREPAGVAAGPKVFRPLPAVAFARPRIRPRGPATTVVALGRGGDDAREIGTDLFGTDSPFVILGPRRSGRSTVAATVIAAHMDLPDASCLVICKPASPLQAYRRDHRVRVLTPCDKSSLSAALDDVRPRRLLVIDDLDLIEAELDELPILDALRAGTLACVATGQPAAMMSRFHGLASELLKHESGLVLNPDATSTHLLGIRWETVRERPVPGRGLLVTPSTRRQYPNGQPIQVYRHRDARASDLASTG